MKQNNKNEVLIQTTRMNLKDTVEKEARLRGAHIVRAPFCKTVEWANPIYSEVSDFYGGGLGELMAKGRDGIFLS
jgi:hypothetical protein